MSINELRSMDSIYGNLQFDYYLNLDIETNEQICRYQVDDKHFVIEMFDDFVKNNILVDDKLNLKQLYQDHYDSYQRYEYYRFKYQNGAKQYKKSTSQTSTYLNSAKN